MGRGRTLRRGEAETRRKGEGERGRQGERGANDVSLSRPPPFSPYPLLGDRETKKRSGLSATPQFDFRTQVQRTIRRSTAGDRKS
ncbi:MAG: hypothetical protein DMF63_01670 [Acidobacteria bacterium]|nr:MAG: hypothetical protein DMF63_01670 [Acidobacteriota bacterium]